MFRTLLITVIAAAAIFASGCERENSVAQPSADPNIDLKSIAAAEIAKQESENCLGNRCEAPQPLVTVVKGNSSLTFWPYTGENFSGTPQDPINVVFYGKADPRDIRAALMSLDGDRTAFGLPAVAPFNSTWQDAIGDVQAGYGTRCEWVGGVVQLACGDYQPVRFHLRLFKMGNWTVGNAHFEALIPNTTEHQVLNWELAEQLLTVDLMRSGLLDPTVPMSQTDAINDSPFRTIPAVIYNGLPVELRQLIGGPTGNVSEDVPIATDGHAAVFNLAQRVRRNAENLVQDFVIQFDQVLPRPFCSSGPLDYVYVQGPVHLRQSTRLNRGNEYSFAFSASGTLNVTPIDPTTGSPTGPTIEAVVSETHSGNLDAFSHVAESMKYQVMGGHGDPISSLYVKIKADSRGQDKYKRVERCNVEVPGANSPE